MIVAQKVSICQQCKRRNSNKSSFNCIKEKLRIFTKKNHIVKYISHIFDDRILLMVHNYCIDDENIIIG